MVFWNVFGIVSVIVLHVFIYCPGALLFLGPGLILHSPLLLYGSQVNPCLG